MDTSSSWDDQMATNDTIPTFEFLDFLSACKEDERDGVEEYVDDEDFDLNEVDQFGLAGVHYAAQEGSKEALEVLLDAARLEPDLVSLKLG
jgi:hypothetical protein